MSFPKSTHAAWIPEFEIFNTVKETKQAFDGTVDVFKLYGDLFKKIYDFFANFDKNVNHIVENTLKWIYDTISTWVLCTPEWLISNDWFNEMSFKFTIISILLTAIITLVKILINICKNRKLDEIKTIKRFAIALSVSCLFPRIFEYSIKIVNKLTAAIINMTSDFFNNGADLSISNIILGNIFLNEIALILFLGIYLILCIPIALRAGVRWFEIISLSIISPLALSAYIFDDLKPYFNRWRNALKDRVLSQLVQAIFTLFIGLIIFSTPTPTTFGGLITKLLVIGGGLWKMIFPPAFIASKLDTGKDAVDVYKNSRSNIEKTYRMAKNTKMVQKGLSVARKIIFKV